jgi:hypothetical protein
MAKRYDDFSKAKENENTIMLMKVFFYIFYLQLLIFNRLL